MKQILCVFLIIMALNTINGNKVYAIIYTGDSILKAKAPAISTKDDSILNINVASVAAKVDSIKRYLKIAGRKKYKNERIFCDVRTTMLLEFKPKVIPGKPYNRKELKHKMILNNYRLGQARRYINIINSRPKNIPQSSWGPCSTNKNVKYARGWFIRAMK